jgi:hypothetical protein
MFSKAYECNYVSYIIALIRILILSYNPLVNFITDVLSYEFKMKLCTFFIFSRLSEVLSYFYTRNLSDLAEWLNVICWAYVTQVYLPKIMKSALEQNKEDFIQIYHDNVQTATSMGCVFLTVSGTFWRQFWFLYCKQFSLVLTHLEGFSAWDIRKHRKWLSINIHAQNRSPYSSHSFRQILSECVSKV